MERLTKEHLISRGFVCEREADTKTDTYGIWYGNGITLYEDFWEGGFLFATRTKNDEFKSGYSIDTVEMLDDLVKLLRGI